MKKILFPSTNRVHIARQKLLLDELLKDFDVQVWKYDFDGDIPKLMDYFSTELISRYDLVLIRGDRYEMLPLAMLSAYRGIKIAHIEGGDLSGAIDDKVRHAITQLSDIHFATNKESFARLIQFGTDPDWTFNFGSLDVEYAKSFQIDSSKKDQHVLMCHHPLSGEDNPSIIEKIIKEEFQGDVIVIKSNSDSGSVYGQEEYPAEEYINLIANARCLVGNSSSFLKETSIFGTPVVNIGSRQKARLKSANVTDCDFDPLKIRLSIRYQLRKFYEPSEIYFKPDTSKRIAQKIKQFLER